MSRIERPNFSASPSRYENSFLGDNNIRREFSDCFSIILSSCYEDDTKHARYFNKYLEDGTSFYYVSQPKIEQELGAFVYSPVDSEKFLIGFTGIGKTTLIKNFFKIQDDAPFFAPDGSLVAYFSVYPDIVNGKKALEKAFRKYLRSISHKLERKCCIERDSNGKLNEQETKSFYEYAYAKNPRIVININDAPLNTYSGLLKQFRNGDKMLYLTTWITYLIEKTNLSDHHIPKIILIYDDVESLDAKLHIPYIEFAEKITAQLKKAAISRSFIVKSLISLRNYTFRYNFSRQADAMRNYAEDVILKETIPKMKDVFDKRFRVYYENEDVKNAISNETRWTQSVAVLNSVVTSIADWGETIAAIANYDISHSLKMFLRVLTNHRWFAPHEQYYRGAYTDLKKEDYLPLKERTLKALVCGENSVFVDSQDNLVSNLLSVHVEECEGTELLSLYIMEYMLLLHRGHEITLYGEKKKTGKELCQNIAHILNCDEFKVVLIQNAIERLYKQRYLLQSIFESESHNDANQHTHEREYSASMGLYLSIRGNKVMELLEKDCILFEIFRDDIDTDIVGNTIASADMVPKDRIIYLIRYCNQLFQIEKTYIQKANKLNYFRAFGDRFIVSRLVSGIINSISNYYRSHDEEYEEVIAELNALENNMISYKNQLSNSERDLKINLPDFPHAKQAL